MPVSFGFSLAQGSELIGTASDVDGDGIIDSASGTFVISGPGIQWEDRDWSIVRDPEEACPQGPAGDVSVDVTLSESGQPIISFNGSEALGLYVTDYGAKLPMGPGTTVAGGAAYWVIGTEAFPSGFAGPVEYGVLPEGAEDQSEENGAPAGGVELVSEQCYQFSVTTTSFKTGSFTLMY